MPNSYWIFCPKATAALPKVKTFREWILTEAAEDMRRLRAITPAADVARKQRPVNPLALSHRTAANHRV
jgi:LysR family glycine cleavage system transcriptional activator